MKLIAFLIFCVTLLFKLLWGLFAVSRLDIDSAVDRLMFINNYGHMIGLPSRPGTSSTATTGVPTNAIAGFAPSAMFLNYKGSIGSLFYINTGTVTSATWFNVV